MSGWRNVRPGWKMTGDDTGYKGVKQIVFNTNNLLPRKVVASKTFSAKIWAYSSFSWKLSLDAQWSKSQFIDSLVENLRVFGARLWNEHERRSSIYDQVYPLIFGN